MLHFRPILRLRRVLRSEQIRTCSSVHLKESIEKNLEEEINKPKDHPGRIRLAPVEIPERILEAIKTAANPKQIPQFVEEGAGLDRYLYGRHIPLEKKDVYRVKKNIENDILRNAGVKRVSDLAMGDINQSREMIKSQVENAYYRKTYNWKPNVYDAHSAWVYLFGRAAKEYAAINYVFAEIAKRDPEFMPRSFFDFGAGIGTGTWAASEFWKKSLYEYFAVDQCREMNDLSELILRDGKDGKNLMFKSIFYRQFLPASDEFKSHLMLSAFTLNDLPDIKTRLDTLLTLWNKCDGYMVLIENGTNAGFKLIEEAREFLIQQSTKAKSAYVFAPCPHEMSCPRMMKDDGTPCNFNINYRSLGIGQNVTDNKMRFSYVVVKVGSRDDDKTIDWPRLVRPTQVRTRHVRCKLCTHRGKLEEAVITKGKHSKYTYRCAKKSDWGDRLPISFDENESNTNDAGDKS